MAGLTRPGVCVTRYGDGDSKIRKGGTNSDSKSNNQDTGWQFNATFLGQI